MARRKDRVRVVLDTNVILRALMDPQGRSASARTYRLWLQRKLQLVVSEEMTEEYLEVLERLGLRKSLINRFAERLDQRKTVTHVRPGRRFRICRDPDDDMLLDVAQTGQARFLITNDRDLLEIPEEDRRTLKFEIMSPVEFMSEWETGSL
jgi:putative PIN family toxin of toxin-antitoxin system